MLQIALRFEVCSQNYGAPKSRKSHLAQFWDSHSRVPGKKSHLDVGTMASHRVYYKAEGGGRGESSVSMLPVARPTTKGAQLPSFIHVGYNSQYFFFAHVVEDGFTNRLL